MDSFLVTVHPEKRSSLRDDSGWYLSYSYIDPNGDRCSSSSERGVRDRLRRVFGIRDVRVMAVANKRQAWQTITEAGLRLIIRETA